MKLIEVIPYIGFTIFKLGMSKQEINNILGNRFNHKKYSYSPDLLDDYYEEGIRIDYNSEEICIAAHISAPSEALYKGVDLLRVDFDKLQDIFTEEKEKYVQDNNLLFIDTGIAFSFRDSIAGKEKPQVVTVFEKGLFLPYLEDYQKITDWLE